MFAYEIFGSNKYDSKTNNKTNDICTGEISPTNFSEFDNFVNGDKLIAIVCSCHPSLERFINYIKNKNLKKDGFEIITYIDESHTISDRDYSLLIIYSFEMICSLWNRSSFFELYYDLLRVDFRNSILN